MGILFLNQKNLILSSGTINTPVILKRSKISKIAGQRLQMHPTIKVVALFKDKVNSKEMGVPVHQVKEFADRYSFGCSISSKPFLRLAMLDHPNYQDIVDKKWDYMAIYYAMIVPKSFGKIIQIPFFNDPIIYYSLNDEDLKNISEGLKNLCSCYSQVVQLLCFPLLNIQLLLLT